MSKSEQRKLIRTIKSKFSANDIQQMSADILAQVERHTHFRSAQTILLFYSLPDEVYTHHFIEKWHHSKTILLPKVAGDDITIHPYAGPESVMEGYMHIMEPLTAPIDDYTGIDLALIPGVAFDNEGNRLGRGKGYYDRLLALPEFLHTYKIGLAFPFQILDSICHDAHDIIMDEIITSPRYAADHIRH